jgi:hypothetical protein
MPGFQPRLAALARLSAIDSIPKRVPIDALARTVPHDPIGTAGIPLGGLDVDDAEQQQQDDQEPRDTEDPQQQGNHVSLLPAGKVGTRLLTSRPPGYAAGSQASSDRGARA